MSNALLELMADELQEAKEEGIQTGIQKGIQTGIQEGIQKGIQATVEVSKEFGASKEQVLQKLVEKYNITFEKSTEYVEKYW